MQIRDKRKRRKRERGRSVLGENKEKNWDKEELGEEEKSGEEKELGEEEELGDKEELGGGLGENLIRVILRAVYRVAQKSLSRIEAKVLWLFCCRLGKMSKL